MIQFECQKVALKQDSNGFVLTLRIHPDEIPEELLRDFVGARYACGLVRVQEDDTPVVYSNRTMKAGILCRNTMFQQFPVAYTHVRGHETKANFVGRLLLEQKKTLGRC